MSWATWAWGLPLLALSPPVLVLLLQVLMAFRLPTTRSYDSQPSGQEAWKGELRLAVLVPAHNEAAGIVRTLHNLKRSIGTNDRILVVADNCTDDTAELAAACGVEVIARFHATRRGKGYALDFGIRHLAANPPGALAVVDADCIVARGTLQQLARVAVARGCPVQAQDLMHAPANAGMKQRLAEFAWRVKNLVRPLGWHALGLPCQLMGTGMAFPWNLASRMSLANGNIVEDMKLGIDFALQGAAPLFCPDVLVSSEFPEAMQAQRSQRKRWEHGHLGMILGEAPRLFVHAARRGSLPALALALDLIVPPLALLAALLAAALLLAVGYYAGWGGAWPAAWAGGLCTIFAASVLLAWHGWGRQVVTLRELLAIPTYILAKVPLYLGFLAKRQKDWVRTGRR